MQKCEKLPPCPTTQAPKTTVSYRIANRKPEPNRNIIAVGTVKARIPKRRKRKLL